MSAKRRSPRSAIVPASTRPGVPEAAYAGLVTGISDLLEHARRMSARSVNSILTATYWEIGRRIVEFEQGGKARAEYGEELWKRLGADLTAKHGRGLLEVEPGVRMRGFYLGWEIFQTPSGKLEARVRLPPEEGGAASEIGSTALSKSGLTGEPEPPERADGPKLPTALAISGQGKVQKVSAESALVPASRQPLDLSRAVLAGAFPALLVPIRPADVGRQHPRAGVLRNRSHPRRLVGAAIGPADQHGPASSRTPTPGR